MARLTRHELKKDEFRTTYEEFERFFKENYKQIATTVGMVVVVVGSALAIKLHLERQEVEAGAQLGAALRTFRAYVGPPAPGNPVPDPDSFSTARDKYKKALDQFSEITRKFPRTKAAMIATYHQGVCQARLGDQAGAIKTLQRASDASDREVASLAQFALAGELAKSGKLQEAVKLYQQLADHPTSTVPRATALFEMAGAYRPTQPAQARRLYEQLGKEFGSDVALVQAIKQESSSLPQ